MSRDPTTGEYIARWGRSGKKRGFRTEADANATGRRCCSTLGARASTCRRSRRTPTSGWRPYRGRHGRGIRDLTRADYRDNLYHYAMSVLGQTRLDKIDAATLRRLVADLDDRGLSHNTIRLALAPVKLALAQAYEDGLIDRHPAATIRVRGAKRRAAREQRTLTREPFQSLLAAIPDEGDRLLVRFVAETGLRVSEAVPLRWCDIENGEVRVWRHTARASPTTSRHPRRSGRCRSTRRRCVTC